MKIRMSYSRKYKLKLKIKLRKKRRKKPRKTLNKGKNKHLLLNGSKCSLQISIRSLMLMGFQHKMIRVRY
jgi:hypothetical protein